jgi:hypothetical protein
MKKDENKNASESNKNNNKRIKIHEKTHPPPLRSRCPGWSNSSCFMKYYLPKFYF